MSTILGCAFLQVAACPAAAYSFSILGAPTCCLGEAGGGKIPMQAMFLSHQPALREGARAPEVQALHPGPSVKACATGSLHSTRLGPLAGETPAQPQTHPGEEAEVGDGTAVNPLLSSITVESSLHPQVPSKHPLPPSWLRASCLHASAQTSSHQALSQEHQRGRSIRYPPVLWWGLQRQDRVGSPA